MDRMRRFTRRFVMRVATAAVLVGVTATASRAAVAIYADVPGIPGESTAAVAPGQIVVQGFRFGVNPAPNTKPTKSAACGGKVSKPLANEITIIKNVDKATPKLFL